MATLAAWLGTLVELIADFVGISYAWVVAGLTLVGIITAVFAIFTSRGRGILRWFFTNSVSDALEAAGPLVHDLAGPVRTAVDGMIAAFRGPGAGIAADLTAPMGDVAAAAFNAVSAHLVGAGNITPAQWQPHAIEAMRDAAGFALAAAGAGVALDALLPEKLASLTSIGEVLATVAGIDEVTKSWLSPLLAATIARPAGYDANARTRSNQLGANVAVQMHARGIITQAQAHQFCAWAGYSDAQIADLMTAAFGGIAPRQLLRLMNTGLFTDADYRDELTFAGIRPASQHRFLLAAPYLATTSERNQLRAEYEKAYSAGLLSDHDLVQLIDSAEHNTSRDFLILDKVRMAERVAITADLVKEYTTSYKAGLLTHDAYVANLRGIGLQDWKVNTLAGIADANRAATLARQMAAAERALERATAAEERKAAMKAYATGNLDVVGLAAALVATGLTAAQAAAWTELAVLDRKGNLRWQYGLQLPPAQAAILKERVTALTDQVKKELIPMAEYIRQLRALNISGPWVNALEAAAAAHLAGKGQAFRVPVSTS